MEAQAKHDFTPTDPATEMGFKKGDTLRILNYGDDIQWYNAEMDNKSGLVPGNYIHIDVPSWYFGRISRSVAETTLQSNQPEGAFLVRLSESSPNDFSLSVKCGSQVQHFRILKDAEKQYFLWTSRFSSLNKLVDYYRNETVSRTSQIFLRDMDTTETFVVEAMYDFEKSPDDQDGEAELEFKKGELITVYDQSDDHWWGGRIGNREGFFPKLYVKQYQPNNSLS